MSDRFEERILELRIAAEERESLRYPQTFRDKAVELVGGLKAAGWTQKKISQQFEIPWQTLGRWCEDDKPESSEEASESFRPVEVVGEQREVSGDGVSLVSPSGWRIEGLTVAEALEAARRLG